MNFHENKHISFLILICYGICIFFGAKIFFGVIFPWTIPLILAIFMSSLIEKPVRHLEKRKIPRKIASGVCTLFYLTLFGVVLYTLGSTIVTQSKALFAEIPEIIRGLPQKIEAASSQFEHIFKLLPFDKLGIEMFNIGDLLSKIKLPSFDPTTIVNPIFKVAGSVPTILISTVFTFVATYFLTSERSSILGFLGRQMSKKTVDIILELKSFLSSSVFGWIRTQLILISITFFELLIGFTIMHIPYSVALALLIAVIDALPILGVGTVLIPWAVFSLFTGDFAAAATLCIIYAVVLIVRNSIEPKILGVQIGLPPFVTLLCIYFGYRLGGFGGMFLVPVTVIMLCKLQDMGVIKFYK